jgi:Spy/CpxP family protein refolding chaperone
VDPTSHLDTRSFLPSTALVVAPDHIFAATLTTILPDWKIRRSRDTVAALALSIGRPFCALFVCLITLPLFCQSPSSSPQVATITAVTVHQKDAENGSRAAAQYDVSLRIGNTVYVALFTPPSGATVVEYSVGMNVVVMVGSKSITFTKLGTTSEMPILRRADLPAKTGLDWSRAPGEYFSQKLEHLSEKLDLTPVQQARIKPILEQEAGEAGQIIANPVLSREDKLNKLEKIVRSSDAKLKPILSTDQWQTLKNMRKAQRRELRESLVERPKSQG